MTDNDLGRAFASFSVAEIEALIRVLDEHPSSAVLMESRDIRTVRAKLDRMHDRIDKQRREHDQLRRTLGTEVE
jgi:low affinity Fe/Cu permease